MIGQTALAREALPSTLRALSSALAQLVEQLTVNQRVAGSSPAGGATSSCLARSRARSHPRRGRPSHRSCRALEPPASDVGAGRRPARQVATLRRDREDSSPRFPFPSIGPLARGPLRPLVPSFNTYHSIGVYWSRRHATGLLPGRRRAFSSPCHEQPSERKTTLRGNHRSAAAQA